VAYSLQINDSVKVYLCHHQGLSREGRVRLFTNLDQDLRQNGDFFINDPQRRISNSPLRFWYAIVLRDPHAGGPFRQFFFVVNASSAPFGVLVVEFVDEGGPPLSLQP
jgi:hypothetical protein